MSCGSSSWCRGLVDALNNVQYMRIKKVLSGGGGGVSPTFLSLMRGRSLLPPLAGRHRTDDGPTLNADLRCYGVV